VAWVESTSASFQCRHSSAHTADAARVLASLEQTRERLADRFPRTVDDLTVILHDGPGSLAASNPLIPLVWAATDPAARRYVTGWVSRRELHVLAPAILRDRAAGGTGSVQMMALAAPTLYTRRVLIECNHDLHNRRAPRRAAAALRWAWLFEGTSRWFSGESAYARTAIIRRLREGGRPSFPPSMRDAPLLGATVIDLLIREEGEQAAAALVAHLHPDGPRAALVKAFRGRPLVHTEGTWRSHLSRLASASG
jgi:hypothetical protein